MPRVSVICSTTCVDVCKMRFTLFLFFGVIEIVNSSKCPEAKKPHETSCTIFYNCINLPSGGYVWVPSKCTEGLVFQPYLRICVLPGDSWTCDILATESTLVTRKYESPEVIDPNHTSYLGFTDEPSKLYEAIDSSYTIDDISHKDNPLLVTPYPLIEIENSNSDVSKNENMDNVKYVRESEHSAIHKRANYLYEYINRQQQLPIPYVSDQNGNKHNHYTWLSQLIGQLLIYKQLAIPIRWITSPSSSNNMQIGTAAQPSFINGEIYTLTKHQSDKDQGLLLNKLFHIYSQDSFQSSINPVTENVETSQIQEKPMTENTIAVVPTQRNMQDFEKGENNILQMLVDNSNTASSIIMINNYSEKKRYLTVEDYKLMAHQFEATSVTLLPCTKDIRLPNKTDCHKYYTCDPNIAYVVEYSCPTDTVFNEQARICTAQMQSTCNEKKMLPKKMLLATADINDEMTPDKETTGNKICQEIGKAEDPISDNHYYICYSLSGSVTDIKSVRMTCPRNLMFCRLKKICTTRQLCKKQE